jgi:uncharacterized membrane protein YdjX (TVP38/TMEM64 family)
MLETHTPPPSRTPATGSALTRVGGLAALLALASLIAYRMGWFDYTHTLEHIDHVRRSHSVATFVVGFIVIYGIGTSVGLPGLPFTVAAGVLFGTVLGTVLSWAGALVGASLGYWIARKIAHEKVRRWVARFPRVDAAMEKARDFTGMFRLRLIPVLPLGTINFVGGLARAHFGAYLLATALGIIPSLAIYTYFADSLVEGVGTGRKDALTSLIVSSGLLILLSLAPKIVARRERSML